MKKQGKKLYDLISELKYPAEEKEIRLKITEEDFRAVGDRLFKGARRFCRKARGLANCTRQPRGNQNNFPKDRELLYFKGQSVHDPVIPINFESAQKAAE